MEEGGSKRCERSQRRPTGSGHHVRISLVVPNLNTAPYLRQTLRSIEKQHYDDLEVIVSDGGSTDGSLDIISSFSSSIATLISGPDKGHADALNKGFGVSTGEVMGWLNSDDILHKDALNTVGAIFGNNPDINWITGTRCVFSDKPKMLKLLPARAFTYQDYLAGDFRWIQQESTFWRRSLWNEAGGYVNADLELAIDFELWMRFFRVSQLHAVDALIGAFRVREDQRSTVFMSKYLDEVNAVTKMEKRLIREGQIVSKHWQDAPQSRQSLKSFLSRKEAAIRDQSRRLDRDQVDELMITSWIYNTLA
jgi:glycosyltransferase involved in cell wall biosynthesis